MGSVPFATLLYRYFFYGWMFHNVASGSLLQRTTAWRHNQGQSRWLPTYMRRWLVLGTLLFGIASFVEIALASPTLSLLFYLPLTLAVVFNAVTAVCWWFLRFDREFD